MAEPILPLADAVARISRKTPIGSVLKSAEWADVPLALRERAQFSAGVVSLKLLGTIQERIAGQVAMRRERLANGKEATFDRSSFIDAVRQIGRDEGLTPTDEAKRGGLEDITSIPRLGMIYDMQNSMASGFATWKLDQNEGALALWPAYRFGQSTAKNPRDGWPARWAAAGGAVGWAGAARDEMVALKTSPIWSALSRFGTPWPPFDFGSTRELEDVDREEAIALGLIGPDEVPSGGEEGFNDKLEASVKELSPQMRGMLKDSFEDQVEIEAGVAKWKGQSTAEDTDSTDKEPEKRRRRREKPTVPELPVEAPEVIAARSDLKNKLTTAGFKPAVVRELAKMPPQAALHCANLGFKKARKGHYIRSQKTIYLSGNPKGWHGLPSTAAHEVGHHLHYEIGSVTNISAHQRLTEAMEKDLNNWKQAMATKHGQDWELRYKPDIKSQCLVNIAKDLGVEFGPETTLVEQFKLGGIADTLLGISKGQFGLGHSIHYMTSLNHGAMEAYANAFEAIVTNHADYLRLFPNLVDFIKSDLTLKL